MPKATVNRNIVYLKGIVTAPFEFSYTLPDKVFYRGYIEVMGLGGIPNRLPIVTEKRMLNEDIKVGSYIKVNANLRTRNYKENERDKVDVYAFAYDIKLNNKNSKYTNQVVLEGYICKQPQIRYSPTGDKLYSTVLANNRENGIVNYIPIVFFEKNRGSETNQSRELNPTPRQVPEPNLLEKQRTEICIRSCYIDFSENIKLYRK